MPLLGSFSPTLIHNQPHIFPTIQGKSLIVASQAVGETTSGTTTPQFWHVGGSLARSATESQTQSPTRTGVLSKLFVRVISNVTTSTSTFNLRKNGADGNQIISIPAGTSGEFEDLTNTDSVAAGDVIGYQSINGSAHSINFSVFAITFAGVRNTITNSMQAAVGGIAYPDASTTRYWSLQGTLSDGSGEIAAHVIIRKPGKFRGLSIDIRSNLRTTTTTFKFRKNLADGQQVISIGAGLSGIFEDLTHEDTVNDGDDVDFAITTGAGTENIHIDQMSVDFECPTPDSFYQAAHVALSSGGASGTTFYVPLAGRPRTANATEENAQVRLRDNYEFYGLAAYVDSNTTTAAGTIKFRKNGADGNQVISVPAGTTGFFEDITNTDACVAGDLVDIQSTVGTGGTSARYKNFNVWATFSAPTNVNIEKTLSESAIVIAETSAGLRLVAKTRARSETTTGDETLARMGTKLRPLAAQTIILDETTARTKGKLKAPATETITVGGGTLANLRAKIRTASDTTAISEQLTKISGKMRTLATQTITVGAGTITIVTGAARALATETVAVAAGTLARLSNKNRAPATETTTVGAGTAAKLTAKMRALAAETVALLDAVDKLKTVGGGGPQNIVKTITEAAITINEVKDRLAAKWRRIG